MNLFIVKSMKKNGENNVFVHVYNLYIRIIRKPLPLVKSMVASNCDIW